MKLKFHVLVLSVFTCVHSSETRKTIHFNPKILGATSHLYQILVRIQTKNLLYPVAKIVSLDRQNFKISEGLNIQYNTTLASSQDNIVKMEQAAHVML